jgi:hypothetical protein
MSGDVTHEFFGADVLDNFGVDAPIALQNAENHAFPGEKFHSCLIRTRFQTLKQDDDLT